MIEIIAKLTRKFHPPGTERILRLFYHPDKRQNDYLETTIPYDKNLKIHINTSSFIEWQIFFKGHYELPIVNLIKKYLLKGGVFVDVGANIGCHSLVASKIAQKVIALEPVKRFADRIRGNCELNGIKNISIVSLAASDKKGIIPFYAPDDKEPNKGTGSFYKNAASQSEIKAETSTLDEILKNEKRVDFIKIDTEGNDGKVILGSLDTIGKHRPIIVFEFIKESWEASGVNLETISKLLQARDYDLKKIGDKDILCLPR
ncbi:MAG: hypothetical protein COU10_02070 [Candidatus Harrisonbacteria bacterium CG10_big_fil_rev_8_21_14_0_10_45_28]|uniref:Methyltransferase FkbM domain-containing protein n=1 Tax=Candidatus Harrisonbacteria bacterium CG10_big_fil_rev_8_21_14_0_10_45_28 TaxID=1974586 RepID=A0A2H0UNE1_9BACT|nr:MAG: hypothetical protein COU10_02070 [Candidatus Harrisonbacteria bacterium CG10_big_fil_rev_8_21_14_0_10_45_28]